MENIHFARDAFMTSILWVAHRKLLFAMKGRVVE